MEKPKVKDVGQSSQFNGTGIGAPLIPYEHRTVIRRHNPNVVLLNSRDAIGYYLESRDHTVVVVFSDRIVRYSFDDPNKYISAICEFETLNVRRINFRNGIIRAVVLFAFCIVILELVAIISRLL